MNKYTLSIKDLSSKEMQYNTQQKRMPLPEYGRSIQNMVDYALTIQDRAEPVSYTHLTLPTTERV